MYLPFCWLGTLSIPSPQSVQQSLLKEVSASFDQSASLKYRIWMSFPTRTFMVTSPFYEFSAMSASFVSFEDDIFSLSAGIEQTAPLIEVPIFTGYPPSHERICIFNA